ncbi:MAG: J domain-containing protein [Desulfatiglandaceae bacterium]
MKDQPFPKASLKKDLFELCHVLFGTDMEFSLDFLKGIQPSSLKSAFREKALQTHPDRARALGSDQMAMSERFKEVSQAYEKLKSLLNESGHPINLIKQIYRRPTAGRTVRPDQEAVVSDHFYKGTLPKRTLLFGQFLNYSSLVSWRQFIKAITWQRLHRPLIGQIARESGILSEREITKILLGQGFKEKFGECAVRKGYLIPFRLLILLGKQRKYQAP